MANLKLKYDKKEEHNINCELLEQEIRILNIDMKELKEKQVELENNLKSTYAERDLHKTNEERLKNEIDSIKCENNKYSVILKTLEGLKSDFECKESNEIQSYFQKIDLLLKEFVNMKTILEKTQLQINKVDKRQTKEAYCRTNSESNDKNNQATFTITNNEEKSELSPQQHDVIVKNLNEKSSQLSKMMSDLFRNIKTYIDYNKNSMKKYDSFKQTTKSEKDQFNSELKCVKKIRDQYEESFNKLSISVLSFLSSLRKEYGINYTDPVVSLTNTSFHEDIASVQILILERVKQNKEKFEKYEAAINLMKQKMKNLNDFFCKEMAKSKTSTTASESMSVINQLATKLENFIETTSIATGASSNINSELSEINKTISCNKRVRDNDEKLALFIIQL